MIQYTVHRFPDANAMNMIESAINEYHSRTCIRFKARTYERDYVSFTNDQTGCWSSVGRIGGRQVRSTFFKLSTVTTDIFNRVAFDSQIFTGH